MFDTSFSKQTVKTDCTFNNNLGFTYQRRISLLWEEHCLECAPPYCYHNCPLFLPREDSKCIRMRGGIIITNELTGSLSYGIDCTFRKWAKLEASYKPYAVSDCVYTFHDKLNRVLSKLFLLIARMLKPILPKLSPYGAYVAYRRKLFKGKRDNPNLLYIKCLLKEKEQVQILVQIDSDKILFSQSYLLKKGLNELALPLNHCLDGVHSARILIAPLNEETDTRIIFGWLDLFCGANYTTIKEVPADKVKVLVWDLDNTLWDGTLVNGDVSLRKHAVDLIQSLDKRGILNTISSKNDYEPAVRKLKDFGILEYFLCPAINWGQKSINICKIAESLNLGINSFAFIDDNIREREEVRKALPMVRVYSDNEIADLLSYNEFDVPISSESKNRRISYQQEIVRFQFKEEFNDDYDSFLRGLEMQLEIDLITSKTKERCYELLSRSNQLNLSTNRYTQDEYFHLLEDRNILCLSFSCKDKFGDYGIVSFASIRINDNNKHADLIDFVISCRVAKKKVENAIIRSISKILSDRGITHLNAKLIITKKNGPLASVFDELPFEIISSDNSHILFSLYPLKNVEGQDIIGVKIVNV